MSKYLNNQNAVKEFNPKLFERLCKIQCTQAEILQVMKIKSPHTLYSKLQLHYGLSFEDCYSKFSAYGKARLRLLQYKTAKQGNQTMQVWLGKQWLKQTDKTDITTDLIINVSLPQELM